MFRYKAYPGETYYITSRENVRVKLGDMLAFFDQYLKDGLRTAPSAAPPHSEKVAEQKVDSRPGQATGSGTR